MTESYSEWMSKAEERKRAERERMTAQNVALFAEREQRRKDERERTSLKLTPEQAAALQQRQEAMRQRLAERQAPAGEPVPPPPDDVTPIDLDAL